MTHAPFDLEVSHPEGSRILHCDAHPPIGDARQRGVVLVVHGFKGYKDYGMFPALAATCAAAGFAAIRFNLAHSGMTRDVERFARPDLFTLDTWLRQVHDIDTLVAAVRRGEAPGVLDSGPIVLLGHSRGGVASILAGGRDEGIDHVIAVSAPGATRGLEGLSEAELARLEANGTLETASARTGQVLAVGRAFFDEVDADPAGHDVEAHARRLGRRLSVIHGEADPTVPAEDAIRIATAAGGEAILVPEADHVFNVTNPHPGDATPSPQLAALQARIGEILDSVGKRG